VTKKKGFITFPTGGDHRTTFHQLRLCHPSQKHLDSQHGPEEEGNPSADHNNNIGNRNNVGGSSSINNNPWGGLSGERE